ncbi:MAG: dihydroxyacetone kinase family protein [Propioniciclava sp.]
MTRVFDDPRQFASDGLAGLAQAYPERIARIPGGVVRSTISPDDQVALVIGGGSGHFPAFSGWVGPGLAHGAVCGQVFASPSASQAYSVCRAADNGGGVVLAYGNYAGDVLHFGQAAERLRAEGVDVRTLAVSDDVASNTPENSHDRRGTTGDLFVFKVAAAASERGYTLDEVERVASRANERTRSLGIAFEGCTLPGATEPLFTVPAGQMSVGLGVHGEPGIREVPLGTAAEIADLLFDGVQAEEPPRDADYSGRAVVLLNGLGTVKYEELHIVYAHIARRLTQAGITPVLPEVGELMSSLDMAGMSLTIAYLDAELEELWADPVDTIALRRGGVSVRPARTLAESSATDDLPVPAATEASQAQAAVLADVLAVINQTALAAETELGKLDAVAGDGDHGQGMSFGSTAAAASAREALAAGAGARTLLVRAGDAWSEGAGGTSGALWGAALTAVGGGLSDSAAADASGVVAAVNAGIDAILRLGGAQVGDKTMVDALVPFRQELASAVETTSSLAEAWGRAAQAATQAAGATSRIAARRGRSRVLGDKSVGTADPGATSAALLLTALANSGLLRCR